MWRGWRWGVLLACIWAPMCAHNKIGTSNVDDTPENREVLAVIETYQRAMEGKDADLVLSMVSPRYFEDNGNLDPQDDYDFAGLAATLKEDFSRTQSLRLEVMVDDVIITENRAEAFVMYTVRGHAKFPTGLKWKSNTDRARLAFERSDDGRWLIVSGL